jgi:outer membrane protein assembly factor BamB
MTGGTRVRRTALVLVPTLILVLASCGGSGRKRSPSGGGPESGATESPARRWRWVAPPPSYVGMPAADDEGVVVTYGHSHVVLLDAGGRPRWTVDHPSVRDVAARLTPDTVLVPTEDGLLALDRATGATRWEARIGERANTPVVAGDRAVVSTWDGSLAAFDLAGGRVAWRVPIPGVALGPAGGDDSVVITTWEAEHGAGAGALAVDPATGRQRWAVPLPEGGVSGPGLLRTGGERLAVVIAGDIAAHALALDSGTERWSTRLEGAGSPEVVPVDAGGGTVLLGHRLGGLVLLDGTDGRVRWEVSTDGVAVRGGPAGPGPGGAYALPLDDGRLLLAGPDRPTRLLDPPGRVSGVASGPGGALLVATRETKENDLTALSGW